MASDLSKQELNLLPRTAQSMVLSLLLAGLALQLAYLPIAGSGFSLGYWVCWGSHLLFLLLVSLSCALYVLGLFARSRGVRLACFAVLVGFIYFAVQGARLPILARDSLIYHLAVPKLWVAAGGMVEIPWNEWSYFPLLLSLAYAGFLKLELVALLPWYYLCYCFLTAGVCGVFTQRLLNDFRAGLVALVLVLTIPLVVKLSVQPMADFPAALFFLVGVFLLYEWLRAEASNLRHSLFLALAAGVAFGLSLSCKYSAMSAVGIAGISFPFLMITFRQHFSRNLFCIFVVTVAALIPFAPWVLRNLAWTGNPIYPLFPDFFADGAIRAGGRSGQAFMGEVSAVRYRMEGHGDSLLELVLLPLRLFFDGRDGDPQHFAGVLSPLLLLGVFAPVMLARRPERRVVFKVSCWLLAIVLGYLLSSLLLFHALARYQLIVLPLWIILVVSVVFCSFENRISSNLFRNALLTIVVLASGYKAFSYGKNHFESLDAGSFLSGRLSEKEYLRSRIGEYRVAEYVNENLPDDARILLFYTGNRFFYYDKQVEGQYFSAEPVLQAFRRGSGAANSPTEAAERLQRELRAAGYDYLVFHEPRMSSIFQYVLDQDEQKAWSQFIRNSLERVHRAPPYSVWKIRLPRSSSGSIDESS